LEKTVILRLLRKEKKNTHTHKIMKIRQSEVNQVNRFTYLGSMVEKNCKIQNETYKQKRKASKFYHLIKSILQNTDTDGKCKTTM
jgi:hypothetical protein